MRPMAWNTEGRAARGDAGDDAEKDPDGEIALEYAHGGGRISPRTRGHFALHAHAEASWIVCRHLDVSRAHVFEIHGEKGDDALPLPVGDF